MNVVPPKDRTPIRINGEIVDGTIKNPINFKPPSKNYMNKSIPKKIKINPEIVNAKEIVDKSTQSKDNRTFSSKQELTPNKKEILENLLNQHIIKKELNHPVIESNNVTEEVTVIDATKITDATDPVKVPSVPIKPEVTESFPDVSILLDDDKLKKPTRRVKRVIKKKIKKIINPKKVKDNIPNYDKMTEDERMVHRNDFILKFDLLRKWHPGLNIQKGIEHHPNLRLVHSVYELYLGCIYNEINSNFYRGILLISWLGLDLFGTYVLGLDTSTYLKDQINLMWAYEPLINEMSKVNFYHVVESWSPFQKLIGLIFGTYVFTIVVKLVLSYVGKKLGTNLDGLTSTALNFISSMIFSKPKDNAIPPININFNGQTQSTTISNNLGGIHNVAIPQSSSLSATDQLNMASTAISVINAMTGKGGNKPSGVSNPVQQNQPQPRSRFVAPSF